MTKDKEIEIAANDETIINGANDLSYMYSVNDVHNIAIALRQRYLNYEGIQDANPGEEYAYLRENNNQILLLDAYAVQNLQNGIEDDVDKIISEGSGTRWHTPPQTILIPFLTAAHWISIKVDINYNDRSASLLWDNPYGLSYEVGEYEVAGKTIGSVDIITYVLSAVQRLMQHYLQDNEFTLTESDEGNWTLNHQQMDQQGLGVDGVSCGTITLRNIEDYLDARVNHGQNLPTEYTIPEYKGNIIQNRAKLHTAKEEHVKMYCEIAEEEIPDDTDSILSAFDEQESDRVIAEFEKKLFPQGINHGDFILPNIEKEKAKIIAQVKTALVKTQEYIDTGKFKQAEDEIVKILHPVLSKPEAKSLYVSVKDIPTETLNALHHLGQIYLRDSSYYNNHVKASAIFQYCARFSKEYKITIELPDSTAGDEQYFTKQAYLVERDFLEKQNQQVKNADEYLKQSATQIEAHINELKQLRTFTKEKLKDIESLGIEQIAERTKKVQDIYKVCTDFFVTPDESQQGLVQRLIFESIEQLGGIPQGCQYSIMGLGSLAFGTMTPWSDLEFAVLIKDKENKGRENEYREYFRNLTKLLWIKVINFGETPLSAVGVDSLNNYKTGEEQDNWFEDNITGKAFRFDPVYEDACKSALGRQGDYIVTKKFKNKDGIEETKTIEKPNYELIKTPKEMMEFQDKVLRELPEDDTRKEKEKADTLNKVDNTQDSWFYTEKHLVQTLQTPVLICGSKELLSEYRQELKQFRDNNPELVQTRALKLLQEDTKNFSLKLGDDEEGKLFNAKTTIYRLGDRIVNALANYYGITAQQGEHSITVWQIIDRMEQEELLSSKGAQHLREAISISTGLRLSTYSHNEGRFDNLSTYVPVVTDHLSEKQQKELMEKTFYVQDTSILHHFYYVMFDVQQLVQVFCDDKYHKLGELLLINSSLFANNDHNQGMIHARFLEYGKALKCIEKTKKKNQDDISFLEDLSLLYRKIGLIEKSIETAKLLILKTKEFITDSNHPYIATSYNNLGTIYNNQGNYDSAIEYHAKALEILSKTHKKNLNYSDIVNCHNNLGLVYDKKGKYDQAIKHYNTALKIYYNACESRPNYSYIASYYNNLGLVYNNKGEYNKAIRYYNIALEVRKQAYASNPNHPDIALNYNSLATLYNDQRKYDQAKGYYNKALEIYNKIYESIPDHPDIARINSNLGLASSSKEEYDQAKGYYDKALKIYKKIYESIPNHPDFAEIHNNLGDMSYNKKEYDRAINDYNKALEIINQAYASNPNHPDIAKNYNNLGATHKARGEYDLAIEHYYTALKMMNITYGSSSNHPDIAKSCNNLGQAYKDKEDYDQAIKYFNKALNIWKIVYKSELYSSNITNCYINLGTVYDNKKKYDQAIEHYKQALNIMKQTYASSPCHPSIASIYKILSITFIKREQYEEAHSYALIAKNQDLCNLIKYLCVNQSLLEGNHDKARDWYAQIDPAYQFLDLNSIDFIRQQIRLVSYIYNNNILVAAINCQKVLLQVDSELREGNHYHNLACFYSCQNKISEANDSFINALNHPNAKVTGELYVEYAQFLIINSKNDSLKVEHQEISKYLYKTINCYNVENLQYGRIEKNSVCDKLLHIIKEKNDTISVNPKILAYYLLITNPEYITEGDSVENLLNSLKYICDNQQDEVSFELLADAYKFTGNEELALEYSNYSNTIIQMNKIIDGKLKLDGNSENLDINNFIDTLSALATGALLNRNLSKLYQFDKFIFNVCQSIALDKNIEFERAVDNLALSTALNKNFNTFFNLILSYKATPDLELIRQLGGYEDLLSVCIKLFSQYQIYAASLQEQTPGSQMLIGESNKDNDGS